MDSVKNKSVQLKKLSTAVFPNFGFIQLFYLFDFLYRTLFDIKGKLEPTAILFFKMPKLKCMIYDKCGCILVS